MTSGPEWEQVELPLLEHLASLGWETLIWSERHPSHNVDRSVRTATCSSSSGFASALLRINPGPGGAPWLDDARINAAVAELRSPLAGARLLEANRRATDLLLNGTTVAGVDGWDGGRDRDRRLHRVG